MQLLSRRNILIASTLLIAVIVLVVVLLTRRDPLQPPPLKLSEPFAGNIRLPHRQDDQTLNFFSGASFVGYDLSTRRTTNLTPIFNLPIVTVVRWSPKGALFQASGYSPVDDLYPLLAARKLPADTSYWWRVDFTRDTIELVGAGRPVADVVWLEDGSYVYGYNPSDEESDLKGELRLVTERGEEKLSQTEPLRRVLWADNNRVVTQTIAGSVILHDRAEKSQRTITETKATSITVSPKGEWLSYIDPAGGEEHDQGGVLRLLDLKTGSARTLVKTFVGQLSWNPPGDTLLAYGGSTKGRASMLSIPADTGVISAATLPSPVPPVFFAKIGDLYYMTNLNHDLFIGSENQSAVTGVPVFSNSFLYEQKNYYSASFSIAYFPGKRSYAVYFQGLAAQRQAYEYIKTTSGQDPNFLDIKWYDQAPQPGTARFTPSN